MPRWPLISAQERFLSKVDASAGLDGCHIWNGTRTHQNYGQFAVTNPRRQVYAHRWALEQSLGRPLAATELACHHCDNPPCVNLRHLYVGDQTQNMQDAVQRERINTTGLAKGRLPGKTLGQYRTGVELCGSYVGYRRHKRQGDPVCEPCRLAARDRSRQQWAARK